MYKSECFACAATQADIIGTVEVNQPLSTPSVRQDIKDCVKHFDRYARIQFGHNHETTKHQDHQMGGQMLVAQGGISHILKSSGCEKGGRWTWMVLGEVQLHVIIAYRVQRGVDGINTIRAQEFRHLLKTGHKHAKSPRKAFDIDFKNHIKTIRQKDLPVLVLLDANSSYNDADIEELQLDTGLVNVLLAKHPDTIPLRTYNRGKHAIDMSLCCPLALRLIKAIGVLEFYRILPTDHRSQYLDLYESKLMTPDRDATKSLLNTPSLSKPSTVSRFIAKYKELLEKANLFQKVQQISDRMEHAGPTELKTLIARLNKYDQVWVELVIAATARSRCKLGGTKPWSPTLAKYGSITRYWNSRARLCIETGKVNSDKIPVPQGYNPQPAETEESILSQRDHAVVQWHKVRGQADDLRTQHLHDRIDTYADKHKLKQESAVKQILHSEETKKLHQRQRQIMTTQEGGQLESLLVPKPSSSDPTALMEITNSTDILAILLRRNRRKLGAAHNGHFNYGPLQDLIGEFGEKQAADDILHGRFNTDVVDTWHEYPHREELKVFLQNMQRPKEDGITTKDMEWSYGAEEFRATFSKKSEQTSCGPSGITMPYYKIFCEDDQLAEFHATFIRLPFKYGFSLHRWQHSIQFSLLKLSVPLWEKLRIIQLLEGDFNGGLRFIFATKMMHHADVKKISSNFTYGGRFGRNCHDLLLRVQMFYEFHRIMRWPAIGSDIDAQACYDRQLRNLIALCTRHLGVPKEAAECQARTLRFMQHRVKTKLGISTQSIQHTEAYPMYGSGQGSGAGGANWHGHNEVILKSYSELHPPRTLQGPDPAKAVTQPGVSFVDDNTLLHSFYPSATIRQMLDKCQVSISTWQALMSITGGNLGLEKCHNLLLKYNFDTFRYHKGPMFLGIPKLLKSSELGEECLITTTGGSKVRIQTIEPDRGQRLLGVRLAADGGFKDEYAHRLKQARQMAGKLVNSSATPQDAYMIYSFRYLPAITYCLPITTFSKKQCDEIQKPFINALLPKLRINRHMKRAIVWGPTKYGGLNIKDLYTEQLCASLNKIVSHIRSDTSVGDTLKIAIDAYQIYLGIGKPFFEVDPSTIPHRLPASHHKLTFLWEALHPLGAHITIADNWIPQPTCTNDVAIIDALMRTQQKHRGTSTFVPTQRIIYTNACRLWLKVTMLSDVVNPAGTHIMEEYLYGTRQRDTDTNYPHQEKPPPLAWKEWRMALRQCFLGRATSASESKLLQDLHSNTVTTIPADISNGSSPPLAGATLQHIYDLLPKYWQDILGPIQWPEDDGNSIANTLQNNGTIHAYLDGSVAAGLGAHAYTIRPECETKQLAILGTAPSPGDAETISSLRPEHYGGLCIIIWMWMIEKKFGQIELGQVHCHIDNDTVVKRLTKGMPPSDTPKTSLVTDFDLWAESATIRNQIKCTMVFSHVKGHQDDFIKKHHQEGPLERHAFWNVQMDKLAEATRHASQAQKVPFYKSSKIALILNGSAITTKAEKVIRKQFTTQPLITYICEKESWNRDTFDLVYWDAFGRAMKSMDIHKRINAVKYVFNWQNTGEQKQRFEASQASQDEREELEVSKCPLQCGCVETAQHFLQCKVLRKAHINDRCIDSLHRWLGKQKTHKTLQHILLLAARNWMNEHEVLPSQLDVPKELNDWGIHAALEEQKQIGWHNFFKGRVSKKFGEIQMAAYRADRSIDPLPSHYSTEWWTAGLIKELIYVSLNLWQHRNTYLHDTIRAQEEIVDIKHKTNFLVG